VGFYKHAVDSQKLANNAAKLTRTKQCLDPD